MQTIQRICGTALAVFLALGIAGSHAWAGPSWSSLTAMQQEALSPLAQQWNRLPDLQQQRLLATTKRYPHLTAEQKHRFRSRLEKWSKLTPEQRKAAREKYHAFSKVPSEHREKVKQMVKQEQEKKAMQQPASAVPATKQP